MRDVPLMPILIVVLVILVLSIVLLIWMRYKRDPRQQVRRVLKRYGSAFLENFMLEDALGQGMHLDFVALTGRGIWVIDLKDYRGLLFGGETTDYWTQMVNRKSYRFPNPLYELEVRRLAVQDLVGKEPVQGVVLFSAAGRFPKGKPSRVLDLQELADTLAQDAESAAPAELQRSWETVQARVHSQA